MLPFCFYKTLNGERVVELNSLWNHLTGKNGNCSLLTTMRQMGIKETMRCSFPQQSGKKKTMPCADGKLLLTLLSGLDSNILDAQQNFIHNVMRQLLGRYHDVTKKIESRFSTVEFADDTLSVQTVKTDECLRFVYCTVIKLFAPTSDSRQDDMGVLNYLIKCGVRVPDGHRCCSLSDGECSFKNDDDVTQREKMLGAKSSGFIWGSTPYNNGVPALLGDFAIFMLMMLKLQKILPRQFNNLYQGVVRMGGNETVALAIVKYWQCNEEASSDQLWNELLEFDSTTTATTTTVSNDYVSMEKEMPSSEEEKSALTWIEDLGAKSCEVSAAKASLRVLLEIEIAAGSLPTTTPVAKISKSPPVNFRSFAKAALISVRDAIEQRLKTRTTFSSSHPPLQQPPRRKRRRRRS